MCDVGSDVSVESHAHHNVLETGSATERCFPSTERTASLTRARELDSCERVWLLWIDNFPLHFVNKSVPIFSYRQQIVPVQTQSAIFKTCVFNDDVVCFAVD